MVVQTAVLLLLIVICDSTVIVFLFVVFVKNANMVSVDTEYLPFFSLLFQGQSV